MRFTSTLILNTIAMASGRYYFVPNSTSTTTGTLTNGTLRLVPAFIPQCVAVTRIGAEVTGAGEAGSKVRLGIYANDPASSRPGSLVLDAGQINGDSATVQEIAVVGTSIGPGWVWFGAATQSAPATPPTMRACANGSVAPPVDAMGTLPTANLTTFGFAMTGVSGALPTTFVTNATVSIAIRIFIKT